MTVDNAIRRRQKEKLAKEETKIRMVFLPGNFSTLRSFFKLGSC